MSVQHRDLGWNNAQAHSPFRWSVSSLAQLESLVHPSVTPQDIGKVAWLTSAQEAWVLTDPEAVFSEAWKILGITIPASEQSDPGTLVIRDSYGGVSVNEMYAISYKEAYVVLGSNTIDLSAGNYFHIELSSGVQFAIDSAPSSEVVASFVLEIVNGGDHIIEWWGGISWSGGEPPTLTSEGMDVLGFYTHDGGVSWVGIVLAKDVK